MNPGVGPAAVPAARDEGFAGRLVALGLLVLVTRLPLLPTGYGTDTDGWAVARAARFIARTGGYQASRLPGSPVQEFGSAPVSALGSWGIDGLTALMTVAAAVLLAAILHRLRSRVDVAAAAAFAFVPAVYIASASGMDYLWALAFLLGAVLSVIGRRHALAGLLAGLAIGSRITSAVLLLPLALMAFEPGPGALARGARRTLVMGGLAALVAGLCFLPVYRVHGAGFLLYYEHAGGHTRGLGYFLGGLFRLFPLPFSPALVAGQGTVGVWGLFGCLALVPALLLALVRATRPRHARAAPALPAMPGRYRAAWALAVVLLVLLYLRLPDDEGYLIPVVPFVLLLLATWLTPRVFRTLCVTLLLSPFVLGLDITPPKKGVPPDARSRWVVGFSLGGRERFVLDPLRGPLLMDLDKRLTAMRILERVRARWRALPEGTVVVAGSLVYALLDHLPARTHALTPVDILAEPEVRALRAGGAQVLYLPGARERTARFFGFELDSAGARPLLGP